MNEIVYELKTLMLNTFVFNNKYEVVIYLALIIYAFTIIRSQFKFVNKAINKIKNNQKNIIIGIGIAYLLISNLGFLYFQNLTNGRERINIRNDINKLTESYSDKTILIMPGKVKLEHFSPFDHYTLNKWSNLKIIGSGWSTFSPRFYDNLNKILEINYGYEIILKMLEDNNFILVANDDFTSYLSTFISQHYIQDKNIIFIPIDNISSATIYKPVWINRLNYNSCNINI